MTSDRAAARLGLALVGALLVGGCGAGDGRAPEDRGAPASDEPRVTVSYDTDDPAPQVTTDAPAEQAWALASLEPPVPATVVTSVRRPDSADLPSYLVVVTTSPQAAQGVCDQVGGAYPVGAGGLSAGELDGWGLPDQPDGTLSVCGGDVVPGTVFGVQRDVLLVERDGTTSVHLSAFGAPF